ncbi:hypothetical protein [Streptosporangium lutulentum]|uniref:Uncharacterized protein n=1 Tax=Streptosporangium lutulentum TaxID=1461250 RepID=A0ABT9Q5L2_9ACTN|nr:hypothetical protein [Streptosporangium lutulentum]MDP9841239.1 hypothetical protein [Streptosporangium lutulentum]
MICNECKERRHEECRGGSWCDCQHQAAEQAEGPRESPLGWPRQG